VTALEALLESDCKIAISCVAPDVGYIEDILTNGGISVYSISPYKRSENLTVPEVNPAQVPVDTTSPTRSPSERRRWLASHVSAPTGPPSTAADAVQRGSFARATDAAFTPAPGLARWWEGLNDPLLTTLVDDALAHSPSIDLGVARGPLSRL
jgi:hypothetical protein